MRDPDWNLLRSFLTVAEAGSLSAAARRLGLSQPTLGRHMAELEAQMGTPLLHRTPRGQEPTDAGAELLADAQRMREAADAIARRATGAADTLAGTVRITASVVIGTLVLPKIVAGIRADHPELEIEIVAVDTVDNLLRRDADIAVRMIRPEQIDLVSTHLGDIPIVACAAKSYIARRGRPSRLAELLEHDVLGYDRDEAILRGFAAMGMPVRRGFFRFRTDNHLVLWEAVKAGAGIGFAQSVLVKREPELEILMSGQAIATLPVWITLHRDIRHAPRMRLVRDRLADALGAYVAEAQRVSA